MKKQILLLCIALLGGQLLTAQSFQDDFSDGNFTTNPTWLGSTSIFIVNASNELQLNDVAGGASQLYTPVLIADSTNWEFFFRLEFGPSTSNQMRIYLMSDNSDLTGSLNGYFIQVGESGSTDAIEIYRQTGTSTTLMLRATDGAVGNDPAQARVRITRDNAGNWELFTDYSGGNNLTSEGIFSDNTHTNGSFFGLTCEYTSTRSDKFFFDDFFISPLFVDTDAPILDTVQAITSTTVDVKFNEAITASSAQQINNYTISNGIGTPASATIDGSDASLVHLTIAGTLTDGQTYTLTASNITDLNGNTLTAANKDFTFYDVQSATAEDVVINEIMADPTPTVGLPEVEFVEIFNNSNKTLQLADLVFVNTSSTFNLPNQLFFAGTYLILCDEDDAAQLNSFGTVIGVDGFSALTNGGDDLRIETINGDIIHEVIYSSSWYGDSDKDDGGYTLELINPNLVCTGAANWIASNSPNGGTPGAQNSVFDNTPDTESPTPQNILASSNTTIEIAFDEKVDEASALTLNNYNINGIGNPTAAELVDDITIKLTFATTFQDQTTYNVEVTDIEDCSGNALSNTTLSFTYYEVFPAEPYDIIITEIMADPSPSLGLPETEYIELYNRSDKAINLNGFTFTNGSSDVLLTNYILLPDSFVVVYEGSLFIDFSNYGGALPVADFPSLSNGGDEIQLMNLAGEVIHFVNYSSSWYQDSQKDDGGFSLEMKNTNDICADITNWSASTSLLGGTPGQSNSIAENTAVATPSVLRVFPLAANGIQVFFDRALHPENALDVANYQISEGIQVTSVVVDVLDYKSVVLTFNQEMIANTVYTATIQNTLTDCQGNAIEATQTIDFALPQTIEVGDIIVNEILFNPATGGVDYLELYNTSDKVLNLKDLDIGNIDEGFLAGFTEIENDYLIFPKSYVLITENVADVQSRYIDSTMTIAENVFVENDLPTFPDDEGGVALIVNGTTMDRLDYTDDWHHSMLADDDGVSLERISFLAETQDQNNWQSAAQSVNYGTPGYQNSQFFENTTVVDDKFTLADNTFSPDEDGFQDFLLINYELDQTDYVANISIYDANGRLVRILTRNELLGTNGTLKWDGTNDEGTKARMGIHILFIELIQPNGTVERLKKTCVVAAQF